VILSPKTLLAAATFLLLSEVNAQAGISSVVADKLEADLNESYAQAIKASRNPETLRQEQRAWLWARSILKQGSKDVVDETFYRQRIAILRAKAANPGNENDERMGRYGEMAVVCTYNQRKDDMSDCGKAANSVTVLPIDRYRARMIADKTFMNAHSCWFDAIGTWNGNTLEFSEEGQDRKTYDIKPGACKLKIKFEKDRIITSDPDGGCSYYCGVRGTLQAADPKWPVTAADIRPVTKRK